MSACIKTYTDGHCSSQSRRYDAGRTSQGVLRKQHSDHHHVRRTRSFTPSNSIHARPVNECPEHELPTLSRWRSNEDSDYHRYCPYGIPPNSNIVETFEETDAEGVDETCGVAGISVDTKNAQEETKAVSTLSDEDGGVDTNCCVGIGYKCGTESTCGRNERGTSIAEGCVLALYHTSGTLHHGDRRTRAHLILVVTAI